MAANSWYVNMLNGDDALYHGGPTDPYKTLGCLFQKAAVGTGDTVYVDGPNWQFPITPDGGGCDPDLLTFHVIPAAINLVCRDANGGLSGALVLAGGSPNFTMRECHLQNSNPNLPDIDLGNNGGAVFDHNYFDYSRNGTAVNVNGSNNEFTRNRCISHGWCFQFGAGSANNVILNNTVHASSGLAYLGGAGVAAVKYNLLSASTWVAYGSSALPINQYAIDSNWMYGGQGWTGVPVGVNNVFGNDGPNYADYFLLNPNSLPINAVYEPISGTFLTPGCCDVATKLGNGGQPFANNWRTWTGSAWVPVTDTSRPIRTAGPNLILNDLDGAGWVRSAEVMGTPGAKLKSFRFDRSSVTNTAPGFRADLDTSPGSLSRESQVRAVACGKGFDPDPNDTPVAPGAAFSSIYNGQRLDSVVSGGIPGVDPSKAPCWQAQFYFSRNLQ